MKRFGNILSAGLKISCQDGRHQEEDAEPQGRDGRSVRHHPEVRGQHSREQQASRSGNLAQNTVGNIQIFIDSNHHFYRCFKILSIINVVFP